MCQSCSLEQENMLTLGGDSNSDLFQFFVQKPAGISKSDFLLKEGLYD